MINAIKIVFPFKNASRLGFLIATFDYQKVCVSVYIYINVPWSSNLGQLTSSNGTVINPCSSHFVPSWDEHGA